MNSEPQRPLLFKMHSTMPQRPSSSRNSAEALSGQQSAHDETRRTEEQTVVSKPLSRERLQPIREPRQRPERTVAENQNPLPAAEEDALPAGREARFRSDLEQVAQQIRGIQFGSLVITIQDGVVVQLDRTERTRLRKPQLAPNQDNDAQQVKLAQTQTIRREPRHPDC